MDYIFSPWLIWFLAGIIVMLAELTIPYFVIVFFGLGCWGGAVVAFFAPDAYSAQVFVFIVASVSSLITLRKVAMRVFVGHSEGSESEDMGNISIGAQITVDYEMEAGRIGRVRFRGAMWDAVSEEKIMAGSVAEITGVVKENRACLKIRRVSRV
ncbi:MAG: NfeD family protein [Candidatus Desulforudis sp.]|nr:NfeD family protein [Desulforudis sp.]